MADRVEDLLALDRDVARAAAAVARWRDELAGDPEGHAEDEPLGGALRRTAAKSTWDALGELPATAADAPLRDALRRWVAALLQARVGRADEVARARAAADPLGRFEGEAPRLVSWREAWRGVVGAATAAEARAWLRAAGDAAAAVAGAVRTRAARRVEVARRLGLEHPWDGAVPVGRGALRAAAARLLDATEDVSNAAWREALGGERDAAAVLHAAVAREAGDGWPARPSPRWLAETFGAGARDLPVRLGALPRAVGASSFARALYAFGVAVRVATAPTSTPFALAHEPAFAGAHRLGFVFGALAADPELYVRALGLGRRAAQRQARVLARTALLEARVHAARLLLGDDAALAPSDLFEEVGARLFGARLDARLRGAWPAARDDEPARLVALLGARAARDEMRERFDADWFRNPRAWAHLRAGGAAPAREPVDERALAAAAGATARAFEEALG